LEDYYEEFEISRELTIEGIHEALKEARKKWNARINAPNPEKRMEAERKLNLLSEADEIFKDEGSRKAYDAQLAREAASGKNDGPQPQADQGPSVDEREEALLIQIENLYESGSMDSVIARCNEAINAGIIHSERIYMYLIMAYIANKNVNEARATINTALSRFNNSVPFICTSIDYAIELIGDMGLAKEYLKDAIRREPDNPQVVLKEIKFFAYCGNREEAKRIADSYIEAHPEMPLLKVNVSNIFSNYSYHLIQNATSNAPYFNNKEESILAAQSIKAAFDYNPTDYNRQLMGKIGQMSALRIRFRRVAIGIVILMAAIYMLNCRSLYGLIPGAIAMIMFASSFTSTWELNREYWGDVY
jgi:curved DNA-binding protein CbpA